MSCPPWVGIVEGKRQNEPESIEIIKKYLNAMLENNPDRIILGCTHYPYLLENLARLAPRETFIDPSQYFAEFIKDDLAKNGLLGNSEKGSEHFFVSANAEQFKTASSMFYPVSELPELVDV